jgi:hypothetical protein
MSDRVKLISDQKAGNPSVLELPESTSFPLSSVSAAFNEEVLQDRESARKPDSEQRVYSCIHSVTPRRYKVVPT